VINRFVIFWGLMSALCTGAIAGVLRFYSVNWLPAYYNIQISIVVYLVYWIVLANLQATALERKFQNKKFASRWFFATSVVGFLAMFLHDFIILKVMTINTGGQGALILLYTLPSLAVSGGFVLAFAQLLLIRNRYKSNFKSNEIELNLLWLFIGVLSWVAGFAVLFFGAFFPPLLLVFPVVSTIKGWFINKFLQATKE
jgi:hypothetical protein